MLVHFTIDSGCIPIGKQAREDQLNEYLSILNNYDFNAEQVARAAIRKHLNTHTEFTAAWIACTGQKDEWHQEFEAIYFALEQVSTDRQAAHEHAGKFLGLLVWNEALRHPERWHFTKYPKQDSDYMVAHYFAMDGHICSSIKIQQAANARRHGNELRALDLEKAAEVLRARFRR